MKYTFLHISDLHYCPDWHEESELVCNKFFDDISTQIKNFENVYLVFSGDLVLKGEDENQYNSFLEKFSTTLDKIGLTRDRRICVPGNHDISRSALKPFLVMQDGALSAIKDERTFNDTLPQLSKTIFAESFKNYNSCETKFAHYTCCLGSQGGTGWELGITPAIKQSNYAA
jgi:predicted MPP superfamily phosphohydrolase